MGGLLEKVIPSTGAAAATTTEITQSQPKIVTIIKGDKEMTIEDFEKENWKCSKKIKMY